MSALIRFRRTNRVFAGFQARQDDPRRLHYAHGARNAGEPVQPALAAGMAQNELLRL